LFEFTGLGWFFQSSEGGKGGSWKLRMSQ
jgi:hypothetical protein